jgi:allantoinase
MELPDALLTQLTVINAAERFGIAARKRGIEVGGDADLVLVESPVDARITSDELFYRHKHSPYVGRSTRSRIRRTVLQGKTIFLDGQPIGTPSGQLLHP